MPDLANLFSADWGGAARVQQNFVAPWGGAARVQALGNAYSPPAAPPGGTDVTPGDLTAPLALGPATEYRQVHTLAMTDLRTGAPLNVDAVRIGLEDGGALWTLSASARDPGLFTTLTTGEQPAGVEVTVDGLVWRFLIETVQRPRTHGQRITSFGGRSLAAVADKPYQTELLYSADQPTTAAQLASSALLAAGVELEWKLADWLIPAGAVSLAGTPMDVLRTVAAAVGATVAAHPSEPRVTVESRYPQMPNEWAYARPEVQIHSRAVREDTFDRADAPTYTGVFVAGQQAGALAYVRLEGTSGGEQAPMVTDPLLTDEAALRERGRVVLGAAGKQARVTRSLPVRTGAGEPGVLQRGALVRWVDEADAGGVEIWHGMVRAVSLEAALPVVRQTVTVERHTAFAVDPDTSPPLLFNGPIPDQTGEVGAAFALDLTPYRSGGAAPLAWQVLSGALPAGLAIVGDSIVGTPTMLQPAAPMSLRLVDAVSRMQDSNAFDFTVLSSSRLMALVFEDAYVCQSTGVSFSPTGAVSFDTDGKFGKGLGVNGGSSSSSKLVSSASRSEWDLQGTTDDWAICGWFRLDTLSTTQERTLALIWSSGLNANQFISVGALRVTSGNTIRLRIYHAYAATFQTNAQVNIPYDNQKHFFVAGRQGNTLYMSVDGSARTGLNGGATGGTPWTTAATYRSTPGARNVTLGNNTVNTGAITGMLDSVQLIRGYPFDVAAGFAVPTVPIV